MASTYERRENGDGTYSQNTAITDSDAIIPVDLRDHGMNELNPLVTRGRLGTLTVHSAAAIRDTAVNEITVDVNALSGEKLIVVATTLNQAVTLTAYAEGPSYSYALIGSRAGITSGSSVLSSTDFGALRGPITKLKIRIVAAVAPTAGTLSTFIEGVQA